MYTHAHVRAEEEVGRDGGGLARWRTLAKDFPL